ncbi:hypothetical protein KP509_06G048600 [Ceratopteris richardii]|uniref:CAAX prenyl protease 2 n=1 Tax=Ceratopteris richardii TaxID=49495 RepID=A0A8T2UMG2_CERRI|nr:hypothetical protein KP509_06G048600 [Ceratopteris richardii]
MGFSEFSKRLTMLDAGRCESQECIAPWLAVAACAAMALLYVGFLYVPTVVLRLPPPASLRHYMLRRFASAVSATGLALVLSYLLLLSIEKNTTNVPIFWVDAFGIRSSGWIQAIVFPLLLTGLLYLGPLTMAASEAYEDWRESYSVNLHSSGGQCSEHGPWGALDNMKLLASDVLAWRTYVMVHSWDIQLCLAGSILSPLAAHVFCNIMGFPDLPGHFERRGLTLMLFLGIFSFFSMLKPLTQPHLYNNLSDVCCCWMGFCKW